MALVVDADGSKAKGKKGKNRKKGNKKPQTVGSALTKSLASGLNQVSSQDYSVLHVGFGV